MIKSKIIDLLKNIYLKLKYQKGLLITILLSITILIGFYGKLLQSPNQVYFGSSGDGFRSYYTAIYHIKYDNTYTYFQGMNYPYGEHVMYSDVQPLVSSLMKFISNNFVDISGYTVGVLNILMLFSIVIAAIFIYLIFKELKLNEYYSAFAAVGIAFLSPLLLRFPGHYSLSYVFTIPIILYLLIRFYQSPSWKKSIAIGLYILIMSSFHIYNYAFCAIILIIFWIVQFISVKNYRKFQFLSINLFIQIILPIVLLNLWIYLSDTATDRTAYPWGFLVYKSSWEGIFLSNAQLDTNTTLLKNFITNCFVESEGRAFIGHFASIIFFFLFTFFACIPFFYSKNVLFFVIVLITGIIIHIFLKRKSNIFQITDNKILNIFLWTALGTLLFSFAWPFIFNPDLIHYFGPTKQFRSLGRFSWIFYYIINIAAFYFIYNLKNLNKYFKYGVLSCSIAILYYDAYSNNKALPEMLNNRNALLEDKANITEDNKWVNAIDVNKYQAIIPIPYFHIGSENFWIDSKCNIANFTFIVSLKTGLPTTGVSLGRTSINQTIKSLQLYLEPYRKPDIINEFPSKKPFLVLVSKCDEMNQNEKKLINKSVFIAETNNFSLYELSFIQIGCIHDSLYQKVEMEINSNILTNHNGLLCTDTLKTFVNKRFENNPSENKYRGKGSFKGNIKDYNVLYEGQLINYKINEDYVASFWFGNASNDLYPRTTMEILFLDSLGNIYKSDYINVGKLFSIIDGDWALVDYKFRLNNKFDKIKFTLWNNDFKKNNLFMDELLIRPVSNDIYFRLQSEIAKNNRFYFEK